MPPRYSPAQPAAVLRPCPMCGHPEVALTAAGRFTAHREHQRPSRPCRAAGLLPADIT